MPKNGNRGGNTKKANIPFTPNNEDGDSNVVFGDAKTTRKAKQDNMAEDAAKNRGDVPAASGEGPSKKPDSRKLVSTI